MTYLPSRPANGEVLMLNTIWIVGSSTVTRGSARRACGSLTVSPIVDVVEADERRDVAGGGFFDLRRGRACRTRGPRRPSPCVDWSPACISAICWPAANRAGVNAADGDAADVVGPIEVGDEHLQRRVGIDLRAGDRLRASCRTAAASSRPARRGRAWRSLPCWWRRCAGSRSKCARRPGP